MSADTWRLIAVLLMGLTHLFWAYEFWQQNKINKIVYGRFDTQNKRITNVEALATTAMMGSVAPLLEKLGSKIAEAAKKPDVNAPASDDPPSEA